VCSACQREFAILITEYGALCAACLRVGYDAAVAQGDDATEQLGGMYTDQNGKVYRGN
jgi:hypothetical protein